MDVITYALCKQLVTDVKGDKGDKGDPGLTPNLQVGNVTTLPAGQNATVIIRGDVENPILDFGIPKGQDGTVTYYDEVFQVGELKFLAFDKGESFELNGHTWVRCEGQTVANSEYCELCMATQSVLEDEVVEFKLPSNKSPVGYTYICAK